MLVLLGLAFSAHLKRYSAALMQRLCQKNTLPLRTAYLATKLHVICIVDTKRITMAEQPALSFEDQHRRVIQKMGVAKLHQSLAYQKVSVTRHEKESQFLPGLMQRTGAVIFKTTGYGQECGMNAVVTDPHFKKVSKDEDRICCGIAKVVF